jgi:hypothetical protein
MITESEKKNLMANWGQLSESMSCFAEVKIVGEIWECYIYAMDPNDENLVQCIIKTRSDCETCTIFLSEILSQLDRKGYFPIRYWDFRKIKADVLFKKLKGSYVWQRD